MNDLAYMPRLASIVFVRLPDFGSRPVREQAELGNRLHALIESVLAELPPEDRLVLDVAGGSAVVVPDNPALALAIAETLHARAAPLQLCIGINHGPVKLTQMEDSTALIGDGLQAAAVTASFATPERWLVARTFRDALADAAPEEAERLGAAGLFTDSQVRSHELFAIDAAGALRRRRRLLAGGGAAVAAILAAGVGARLLRNKEPPALPVPPPVQYAMPALVIFDVRPAGDVFIDGQFQGQLPELRQLYLGPGAHQVEVRYGHQPPLVSRIDARASGKITLTHRFALEVAPPAPLPRRIGRDTLPPSQRAPEPSPQNDSSPGFWRGVWGKIKGATQ